MRNIVIIISVLGAVLVAPPRSNSQSTSPSQGQRNSLVVVFKDGHQQRFPMSEVARIEFQASPTTVSNAEQGRFLGDWKVGDCRGGYFNITLNRDGVAKKNFGSPNGNWMVVDGEARISWEDGWHDTILKAGNRYQKAAFAPDRSYAEGPSCTASAESSKRGPI